MRPWGGAIGEKACPEPRILATARGEVEWASLGEGPPVLCLHGALGGYDQGILLARTLGEAGTRYVAPSRPGYLGTPLARGRDPEEQADLYAAMLDALGAERAVVMAVSGGGASAIHFALRHRDRCAGLVLASVPALGSRRPPWTFQVLRVLMRVPGAGILLRRGGNRPPSVEEAVRRSFGDPELRARVLRDPETCGLLRELQRQTSTLRHLRFPGTDNDGRVSTTRSYPLEEIRVPLMVLLGTRDPWIPFEIHGRAFAERVPDVELVPLEGGEHTAIFSHRREARERVSRFLRRLAS